MKKNLRVLSLALVAIMLVSFGAACQQSSTSSSTAPASSVASTPAGSSGAAAPETEAPYEMSVYITDFTTTQGWDPDSQVAKDIEALTNTKVEYIWVPNAEYDDKLSAALAAGNLPTAMLHKDMTNMAIPNAIRAGAFWEVGPYLHEYEYLSQASEIILNNISIDGKVYGVYRSRDLGRLGLAMRSDWLKNLGLEKPKNVDELYDTLVKFTKNDPDQNGQNDTWGLHFCVYTGAMDTIATYFGAPNKWGVYDGKVVPAHMTQEYFDSMVWLKNLYNEGAINQDFATLPSDKWRDALRSGFAGARSDTMDDAVGYQDWMVANADRDPDDIVWTVIPTVAGPDGVERALATSGHAGYFAISKDATNNSEDELRRVLYFFDRLNTEEGQTLTMAGIEGLTYWRDDEGKRMPLTAEQQPIVDKLYHSLGQLTIGIPNRMELDAPSKVREEYFVARAYNDKIVVGNPCEPLLSQTAITKGSQLLKIYDDARVQFICGLIDEAGWEAAKDTWLKQGGQDIINETQALYDALPK